MAIIGPIFGFLLGSLCAKLYVDIGFVDLGKSEHSGFKNPVRLLMPIFGQELSGSLLGMRSYQG